MRVFRSTLYCVVLLIMAAPAFAQAQLGTGAMSGVVLDTSGAAIAGARVTATDTGTALARTVKTSKAGQFNIPVLPSGTYQVSVVLEGFAALKQKDLLVTVGSTVTLK